MMVNCPEKGGHTASGSITDTRTKGTQGGCSGGTPASLPMIVLTTSMQFSHKEMLFTGCRGA